MAKSSIRITKRVVADLKAGDKERFVWDNELIGFGARVSPKGLITYVYQYFLEGRTRRFKIGTHGAPWTPETARHEATRLAGLTVTGDDPQQAKLDERKAMTVAQLCDLYLTEGLLTRKESSIKAARCDIENHIKPLLGRRKVASLERSDLEGMLRDIAAGKTARNEKLGFRSLARVRGGKGAASSALTVLSAALGFGVTRKVRPDNPATGIRKFPSRKIERFLSPAELARLGETLSAASALGVESPYRAGGSGLNQQRGQYYEYNPEYTWNYELALRSQWLDRRLTVNANVYYIDWKDQQVSVQLTPGSVFDTQVINAGKSRLYGAEMELSGRPTRRLNLYLGAGYSNTKFEDSPSSDGTLFQFVPGNEFANAPHWTISGGATWQHPTGLFANVNANYRSGYFQDVVDQPAILPARDIPSRTLVNAKLGWQGKNFGAFLIASNIFDVTKPTQSFVDFDGRTRGTVTEPRILGLSFEGRF